MKDRLELLAEEFLSILERAKSLLDSGELEELRKHLEFHILYMRSYIRWKVVE